MQPVWNPDEAQTNLYKDVERHSDGMISFTYRPPKPGDLDALKNTKTYQAWLKERGSVTTDPQSGSDTGNAA